MRKFFLASIFAILLYWNPSVTNAGGGIQFTTNNPLEIGTITPEALTMEYAADSGTAYLITISKISRQQTCKKFINDDHYDIRCRPKQIQRKWHQTQFSDTTYHFPQAVVDALQSDTKHLYTIQVTAVKPHGVHLLYGQRQSTTMFQGDVYNKQSKYKLWLIEKGVRDLINRN